MESLDRSEMKLAPPELGTVVASRYRVVEKIGEGGMGAVYKAEHVQMGKTVALKMLLASFDTESQSSRRFLQEAKAASQLNHPNIVNIYDFDIDDSRAFLAMDYLDGISLDSVIEQHGAMAISRLLPIVQQACRALAYAHKQGFVHRDIKPSNMMLVDRADESDVLVLVDFGLVKAISEDPAEQKLTTSNVIVGSPLFMSPEQCRSLPVDHRSDIYSLGLVIYRCLTGGYAIYGDNFLDTLCKHVAEPVPSMSSVNPSVVIPPAVEAVVLKALAKDPGQRQQSMKDLLAEFTAAVDQSQVVAAASSRKDVPTSVDLKPPIARARSVAPAKRAKKANVAAWAFASVAVLVIGTVAVCLLLFAQQAQQIALEEDKLKLQAKQQEAESELLKRQAETQSASQAAQQAAHERELAAAQSAAKAKLEDNQSRVKLEQLKSQALAFQAAGDEAMRGRDFENALNNYQKSLGLTRQSSAGQLGSRSAVVLGHAAIAAYELGSKDVLNEILDELSAVVGKDPAAIRGEPRLVLELAELAELNKKNRLAEYMFAQAIRERESQIVGGKDASLSVLYLSEAKVLLRDNNFAQAALAVNDAVQVADPRRPGILFAANAVRASLQRGNTDRALETLERMELNPEPNQPMNGASGIYDGRRFAREPR